MSQAPAFDSQDPESQAAWRQWVTDSIVWQTQQMTHLHECIETRIKETKDLMAAQSAASEELSESRHQQNLQTLERIGAAIQLLTAFRENATQKQIEEQAVASERLRVAQERERRRTEIKASAWKVIEYGAGAGMLTLALAGLYSIARALGF